MKKYFSKFAFAVILTFLIITISVICFTAFAEETDGANNNVVWKFDIDKVSLTATITGADIPVRTKSFNIPSQVRKDGKTYTVTAIDDSAFEGNKLVFGNLTLPDTLTSIGSKAFKDSYIYGDVVIPESVTSIGTYAFENCFGLYNLTIPSGITVLNEGVFKNCTALSSINTENIVEYKTQAFYECKALMKVDIGENARVIETKVFYNCDSLSGVYDLSKLTTIPENAFYDCDRVDGFIIPDIDHSATAYNTCLNIKEYGASENNPKYSSSNGVLLSKDKTTIEMYPPNKEEKIYYTDSTITTIGKRAFLNAQNLEKVIMGDNILSIQAEAFAGSSITSAYIPENVRTVSVDVFRNCSKLEWVVLGSNVIAVGSDSFKNTNVQFVIAKNTDVSHPDNVKSFYYAQDYKCTEHIYGYIDKAPSCSEYGYNTCIVCDRSTYIKELGHSGAIIESSTLSCTSDAYQVIDCLRCGETVKVVSEYTPGHISNGVVSITPAKYMTPGYKSSFCTVCEKPYVFDYHANFSIIGDINCDGEINMYDLSVLVDYVNDPTGKYDIFLNNADLNKDKKYNQLDVDVLRAYLLGAQVKLPSKVFVCDNHTRNTKSFYVQSATCQDVGYQVKYCSSCGFLVDEIYTDKLPHNKVVETYINPSCAVVGQIVEKCSTCDKRIYTNIDKLPHTHNWYTIAAQKGYEYSSCAYCGTFESRKVDYSVFDALIGQIPKNYEVYYSTETIVQIQPIMKNYELNLTQDLVDLNVKRLSEILPNIQYKVTDVPVVYIDAPVVNRDSYNDARITIAYRGEDGRTYLEAIEYNGQVKIRGNSTAGMSKKPFNFKFSSKVNLFDMGASKKYTLLANYKDDTFIKNALTFELSYQLGLDYACKYEIVDVYQNGTYLGAYMLTTAVEVGEDRVDIDEDTDYLFEIEKEGSDIMDPEGFYMKSPLFGIHFLVESPEEMSAEALSHLYYLVSQIDYAIMSEDWKLINQFVDVESVAKYFILHDVLKEVDIIWDSTRFYIEDDKLHGGPAWDFDRCMFVSQDDVKADGGGTAFGEREYYFNGKTEGGILDDTAAGVWASLTWYNPEITDTTDNIWFCSLYKHSPDFVKLVCETVLDYKDEISILYKDEVDENGDVIKQNIIDSIIYDKDMHNALKRNRGLWDVIDFFAKVENMQTWLGYRNDWMQQYYANKLAILNPPNVEEAPSAQEPVK